MKVTTDGPKAAALLPSSGLLLSGLLLGVQGGVRGRGRGAAPETLPHGGSLSCRRLNTGGPASD